MRVWIRIQEFLWILRHCKIGRLYTIWLTYLELDVHEHFIRHIYLDKKVHIKFRNSYGYGLQILGLRIFKILIRTLIPTGSALS